MSPFAKKEKLLMISWKQLKHQKLAKSKDSNTSTIMINSSNIPNKESASKMAPMKLDHLKISLS